MTSSTAIYPWQTEQWQHLKKAQAEDRLPHALILSGLSGLGKHDFSQCFVQSLHCQACVEGAFPCGHCQACHQFSIGTLPDVLQIMPQEKGKQIPVDEIRKISGYLSISSIDNQYRCVIIHDAENMNTASMNALLKILEEPPGNALLILVTAELHRLTATIKSRCQKINFGSPNKDTAIQWLMAQEGCGDKSQIDAALSITQNAPLKVQQLIAEKQWQHQQEFLKNIGLMLNGSMLPVELASQYEKQSIDALLYLFLLDLLKYKADKREGDHALPEDGILKDMPHLQLLVKKMTLACLWRCLEKIIVYRRNAAAITLNYRLFLEDVFIELTKEVY